MSGENLEELAQKITLLERQLAAVTAERDLLKDQLNQAQEAALTAERKAASATTELKIWREQNQISDGRVVKEDQPSSTETQTSSASTNHPGSTTSPDRTNVQNQSRIASLWRWLWEENDRNAGKS